VNPLWGAVADLRMFWLALSGGLAREIDRCNRQSDAGFIRRHDGFRNIPAS
jgi:hypothetical protein